MPWLLLNVIVQFILKCRYVINIETGCLTSTGLDNGDLWLSTNGLGDTTGWIPNLLNLGQLIVRIHRLSSIDPTYHNNWTVEEQLSDVFGLDECMRRWRWRWCRSFRLSVTTGRERLPGGGTVQLRLGSSDDVVDDHHDVATSSSPCWLGGDSCGSWNVRSCAQTDTMR